MRYRSSLSVLLVMLLCCFEGLFSQSIRDTTLQMSDGITLDAFYVYPTSQAPTSGYPGVLLVHGFGGSKSNNNSLAQQFARDGYVVTSYSVRGQGASEGLFDFFTSDRILDDLRAMIAFTKSIPQVNSDRVGVMGGSQGGLHAWNAAAYDMGARAVVSVIANGRFRENWLEHDALNWTFAAATLSPNVRFDPAVLDSITRARESGDHTYLRGYLENASTKNLESSVTTPTAIFISYFDGFFDQNAALRQFSNIPGPKRIIVYPGGHSFPSDPGQSDYVNDVIARWMGYWLLDQQEYAEVAAADSAVMFFDTVTGERRVFPADSEAEWLDETPSLPAGLKKRTLYFTDDGLSPLPQTNAVARTINYINVLGSQPLVFQSDPLSEELRIAPRPGSFQLRGGGTGSQIQFNLLLYDFDPAANTRTRITRSHAELPGDADVHALAELNSVLHTVASGHIIEARVDAGMALLPDQQSNFGNYVVGPVDNSITTFTLGGDEPSSRLQLYVYDDGPVSAHPLPFAEDLRLDGNWPNPFNPTTTVRFHLGKHASCRLTVSDCHGREVAVLHEGFLAEGSYRAIFDARDLPAGLYIATLHAGSRTERRKMLLVK